MKRRVRASDLFQCGANKAKAQWHGSELRMIRETIEARTLRMARRAFPRTLFLLKSVKRRLRVRAPLPGSAAPMADSISDTPRRLRFRPFEFDLRSRELWKHGHRVRLEG